MRFHHQAPAMPPSLELEPEPEREAEPELSMSLPEWAHRDPEQVAVEAGTPATRVVDGAQMQVQVQVQEPAAGSTLTRVVAAVDVVDGTPTRVQEQAEQVVADGIPTKVVALVLVQVADGTLTPDNHRIHNGHRTPTNHRTPTDHKEVIHSGPRTPRTPEATRSAQSTHDPDFSNKALCHKHIKNSSV